ncbi:MAG: hypothetical protein MUC87_21395 [Bacteroidia bacterium]|jgi:hypothetical protein|nr:hypothetical protein [Bacteroidia bacterium]
MPENNNTISFVQHHLPAILSGDYSVSATQTITLRGNQEAVYTAEQYFYVAGKRYSLDEADVNSVFPPQGSAGQFYSLLPHIVLNSSSLPWQRSTGASFTTTNENVLPWMALLMFDESEGINQAQPVTIDDLCINNNIFFPEHTSEPGESDSQQVNVIDVPLNLFLAIAPSCNDLQWLGHVRVTDIACKPEADDKIVSDTYSVLVANRVPQQGKITTMHLVSLEGYGPYLPDYDGNIVTPFPAGITSVRLVSLYSWSFRTEEGQGSLAGLLTAADMNPAALQLPFTIDSNSSQQANANVLQALGLGYTALNHQLRNGDRTVSWYRGPLLPLGIPQFLQPPYTNADSLMRYDPGTGMFDASYSGAWQLGKLMALRDSGYAQTLVRWKATQTRAAVNAIEEQVINAQLGVSETELRAAVSAKQVRMNSTLRNFIQPAVSKLQKRSNS